MCSGWTLTVAPGLLREEPVDPVRLSSVPLALACVVAAVACGSAQRPNDAKVLGELAAAGCNPRLVFVWVGPDSIPRRTACIVATAALKYIGAGGAKPVGVLAADTLSLARVIVTRQDMTYPDRPTDFYWEATFARPGARTSVAVRIDRVTGRFSAKLAEPIERMP
jgi:hypothetical protein